MLLVGLTGGLASGKSFVGEQLRALGCHLIKADELGHAVLEPGGEAYDATVQEFGVSILRADGSIDRKRLASLVFNDPPRLERLNSFVHPAVRARSERLVADIASVDPQAIIVSEAAILIETGSYKNYDRLIVAVCSEDQQIERAMHRDGLTREETLARLRRQLPLAEKVKYADFLIDTSGSKEETIIQTRAVFQALRSV
jgi:dephospho-CoA kinase